jgi:thiol-disulfide isomerase/thioredoxin
MAKKHSPERLSMSSERVSDYLSSVSDGAPAFAKRRATYRLKKDAVEGIRKLADRAFVVVFSAEWCPDCHRNVPVLGLIAEETDLEVRVFGHLMRDPKNIKGIWKIPPSPPEVKEFEVTRIPLMIVLNSAGEEVGEVVENPPEGKTLEEAILEILMKA